MYLIDDGHGSAFPARAHIRDHLAARLHADRIDVQLARGAYLSDEAPATAFGHFFWISKPA